MPDGSRTPAQANTDRNFIDNSPPYVLTVDDKTLANSDGAGDACDPDDDNDGLADSVERNPGPMQCPICRDADERDCCADTDGDRFLDGAECALGTNPHPPQASRAHRLRCRRAMRTATRSRTASSSASTTPDTTSNDTDGDRTTDGAKDGCEIASLNGDRIVSSIDQGMLAQGISGSAGYTVNVDINKDGVLVVHRPGHHGQLHRPLRPVPLNECLYRYGRPRDRNCWRPRAPSG